MIIGQPRWHTAATRAIDLKKIDAKMRQTDGEKAANTGLPAPAVSLGRGVPANAVRKPEPNSEAGIGLKMQVPPIQSDASCAQDAERLDRLRAAPTMDAIVLFERELGCDRLRPQLRRLRESVGQ
jgi:hypothetical protein